MYCAHLWSLMTTIVTVTCASLMGVRYPRFELESGHANKGLFQVNNSWFICTYDSGSEIRFTKVELLLRGL